MITSQSVDNRLLFDSDGARDIFQTVVANPAPRETRSVAVVIRES